MKYRVYYEIVEMRSIDIETSGCEAIACSKAVIEIQRLLEGSESLVPRTVVAEPVIGKGDD